MGFFSRKREEKLLKQHLTTINANAEKLYKKFSNSQAVRELADEIKAQNKVATRVDIRSEKIHVTYADRTEKDIYYVDKGLPKLGSVKLGSGWQHVALAPYFDQFPYLAFCSVESNWDPDSVDPDYEYGKLTFYEPCAVSFVIAALLEMPISRKSWGYSCILYQEPTATHSW